MSLDDLFRDPPEWDTDSESESSSIRNSGQERRVRHTLMAQEAAQQQRPAQQDTTDLDAVFRDAPVWDTDSDSEGSHSRQSIENSEEPDSAVVKRRDWGEELGTEQRNYTPSSRIHTRSSPTVSRPSSPPPLSSISEHGPIFVRPSILRSVRGSSFIKENKTIDLSVLSVSGFDRESKMLRANAQVGSTLSLEDSSRTLTFAPRRLLDVEQGKSVLLSNDNLLLPENDRDADDESLVVVAARSMPPMSETDPAFFKTCADSLQDKMKDGDVRDFHANDEVGVIGGAWRGILKRLMLWSYDEVNALLLTRQIQLSMPFQTGYEAYVLGQLIEAFESGEKNDIKYTLNVAFQNRNTSRILVQIVGPRYDFVWHWSTMIRWNRPFDAWGQLPFVGFTAFPPTENFPNTFQHAIASITRIILGQGNWLSRVVTGREGLITDDPDATAQNLAAESNGFELANRNQYGTYVGRRKTNEFRFSHRLPTDESVVRSFVRLPTPTLLNNGVVHVLRQLAKHWHNMLRQPSGNFAHQRMEQLNPFETLRFHMPVVLLTLSSLRGRNKWDSDVLGPMMKRLQSLKPSFTTESARRMVHELKESIVVNVCAGVASVIDPFRCWLDAIGTSLDEVEEEAKEVHMVVSSVEIGLRLAYDLITQVSWKVPDDAQLKTAILNHIRGLETGDVSESRIRTAMSLITPRDKRTLIELVKNGLVSSRPAQLLLGRAKTLLQRELRREVLNETIRELSKGDIVTSPQDDEWYWLQFGNNGYSGVYIFDGKVMGSGSHRFVHIDTKSEKRASLLDGSVTCRAYVPVGESISRAQRAFMNIELDFGKTFAFDAFMEFSFLREKLRRLISISQLACEMLDIGRLNLLAEVQRSNQALVSLHDLEPGKTYYKYDSRKKEYTPFVCEKEYTPADAEWSRLSRQKIVSVPPQSMIMIGGGPTGLMTTIHCTEAVLASGGVMKLYEARDTFARGGAAYERAQIVRLDARWIAMLRYHLGTGFEDVFIPASGETDSQLGNTLPTQGFVEITIKDLEQMLHVEVSKMWSKGLLSVYTDSKASYDHESNTLTKRGEHLKKGDDILRRVDKEGRMIESYQPWKVVDLVELRPLGANELLIGEEYGIFNRLERRVVSHTLVGIDLRTHTYVFTPSDDHKGEVQATVDNWPSVFPAGVGHGDLHSVVVECRMTCASGGKVRESLPMEQIRNKQFVMDVGHSHVVEAIGKPHGSKVHFQVTTYEPYGVCCCQGLKVSMGMHNFGERRWRSGIEDDIRSQTDQNTRIIGDFTKMCRSTPVAEKMLEFMTDEKNRNWQLHFTALVADSGFTNTMTGNDEVVIKIRHACAELATIAPTFRRQTLQTRFFETGDNFYLGMEFMREYVTWRDNLATSLVGPALSKAMDVAARAKVEQLRSSLMHHIDRMWYEGVLEVIRTGDVYNPGARHRVPRLYLVNSHVDEKLGGFPVGESFRLSEDPDEMYEIMAKGPTSVIVRNVEGYISKMPRSTLVRREGNLTRSPDGNSESRVALATFPVSHFVNHRTARLNDSERGYVFAFIGDEQATPHFMRYSGLTGACINAMLFNNFIKQANGGVSFIDRLREYSTETNWSNGEVVARGTGSNYGEDGFLRPGFSYECLVDYLHSKVIEYQESGQDLNNVLTPDWRTKLGAALVPRGMEMNETFIAALHAQLQRHIFNKLVKEATADKRIPDSVLKKTLRVARGVYMGDVRESLDELNVSDETRSILREHVAVANRLDQMCRQVINHAKEAYRDNQRISGELVNQSKSVDSIVDDFAVEAQSFATSLTQSAAFAAGALAFKLVGDRVADTFSIILTVLNIFVSFGTMTNSARYKIRNEEARVIFAEEKMLNVMKAIYAAMNEEEKTAMPLEENPFVISLEQQVAHFMKNLKYYTFEEPKEFLSEFHKLKQNVNDPSAILRFMKLLSTKFIVDTYHVNSYVQEALVNIYKSLDEMLRLLDTPQHRPSNDADTDKVSEAWILFHRLSSFSGELERTLQRGATHYGFVKRRRILQWDCAVMFKYLYSLMCCSSRACVPLTAPTSTKTSSIIKHAKHLSKLHDSQILRREIRDMETLYWATRESDIASLVFMSGFLVFVASVVFTIARIFRVSVLVKIAFWAALPSAFGAILALFHLWRKLLILVKLMFTLGQKNKKAKTSADRNNIQKVLNVTFTQILLTLMRLFSAASAAVALPWSVAVNGFGSQLKMDGSIPFWIALGSVCTAIASTLFFFIVEFVVRYNLSPKLGEFVCESFRSEIEEMHANLSRPMNDIDTKQVQERETWEYVSRSFLHSYRFDAVFAADRFGSILQYLQSSMDRHE